ncbi:MAG TPA: hypothetical protein VJM51_03195 [Dehalococcoidia bacterium]|nr:hypothetical protein [Dehalococcoidia bacterium]
MESPAMLCATSVGDFLLVILLLFLLTYRVFGAPGILSTLTAELYINQIPVVVTGIIANVSGIAWVSSLLPQTQPQSVAG